MEEKLFLEINGVRQGMILQSTDSKKPVLLFLHGGPGSPEVAFTQKCPTGMEQIFTVCWWEQRGSGMSYSASIPKETINVDQMIADTIAVTNYLRERFQQDKIYVMGHSWGSVLGILTVQKAPELFVAYLGMGQVARQEQSERLAYAYMLEQFQSAGNDKMVRKLTQFPIDQGGEITTRYLTVRSEGMLQLGIGIMHNARSMLEFVKIVMSYKGYTWQEKLNYPRGNSLGLQCLWDYVMGSDFCQKVPSLAVPVYIFQGKFDYQVSYAIAKEFAMGLKAPIKGFYTFEHSAHSPCFEEPEKLCRILREDVLQGKTELADRLETV